MRYALVRVSSSPAAPRASRLDLDSFARAAGLHPELVRRLMALGLLDGARDGAGTLWFATAQLSEVARLQRLRAGLGLNYASLALVVDLLDRIAELQATLRSRPTDPVDGADDEPGG